MSKHNHTSRQLSFWQLIQEYKIEIPIIQRDYAQGRADKTKLRNLFLNDIKEALTTLPIELDFVYGSTQSATFQPLDGQQRLTTLFLLHWYIATKEEQKDFAVKEILKRFTYLTRTSSTEFCNKLVEKGVAFKDSDENITSIITNESWFVLSWKKDPTIKAMLVMLDAIHAIYKKEANLWSKLIDKETRPLTFHFIELENFGLSDDLYINMNARGKQLTPFEIFKANFIKHIESNTWDQEKDIQKTFSHKADTIWTDLFWQHKSADHKIDSAYMKFIAGIAINLYARNPAIYEDEEMDIQVRKDLEEKPNDKKITENAVKTERIERRIAELFNDPGSLEPRDFCTQQGFDYLANCLDVYSDKDNNRDAIIPANLILWEFCKKPSLFMELIKTDELTYYKPRVLFFAQTEYLLANPIVSEDAFSKWMRVVRNIVQNSTIDSAPSFRGAINLITELLKGCADIYTFLSVNTIISKFADVQVKEEKVKSTIITEENKKIVFDTEDTNFCKGRITFALHCTDYETSKDKFDPSKLAEIQKVIVQHLDGDNITNEFRRALLTIDDHHFYDYWATSKVYVLDEIPKRCLITSIQDLKNYVEGIYKRYLKILLNQLTIKEIGELLKEFSLHNENNPDIPNWKKRLIKEPKLLDNHCQSHFIAIADDEEYCYLLRVGKPRDRESCKKIK